MEIKLKVFCDDDLEVQAKEILELLEQGNCYKEIKRRLENE